MSDREWAARAFRPAKLHGSVQALRTAARTSERSTLTDIIPRLPSANELLALAAIAAGAFVFGRWWGRRRSTDRLHEAQKRLLQGVDVLGAG